MYVRLLWEQYWGSSPPCEAFGPLIFHNTRSRNRDSMNNILSLIQIELRFNIQYWISTSSLVSEVIWILPCYAFSTLREGKKFIHYPKLMAIEPAGQAGYCASWGNANIDGVTLSSCFLAKRWANAGNGFHLIRPPHLKQYWFGRALSPKINLDLIKLLLFQYWFAKIWRFALRVTRESAARASPQKCASGPIWTQFLFP